MNERNNPNIPCYDSNGELVEFGDKIRGEGFLHCQGTFKIDLSPIVTVRNDLGIRRFGYLSASSYNRFFKVTPKTK